MTTNACHQRLRGKERSRVQKALPAETQGPALAFLCTQSWYPRPESSLCPPMPGHTPGLPRVEVRGCLSQPADQKQPHPPASRMQACLQPTPAPDCGLSRGQDRTQGTDVPILWLPMSFLKKSRSQPSSIHL